jgi:Holliday junction resolvasome RuvABC ATP-dependent DNA helicase subunit
MGRPLSDFHGFFGQRAVVSHVRRLVRGARVRGEPLPPLLLLGPSGVGKTKFVGALAAEAGVNMHLLFAARSVRVPDVVTAIAALPPYDLLLIDEAHSLGEDEQQVLFRAIDCGQVPAVSGRRVDHSKVEPVGPFGLIVATNQPGRVVAALRRRTQEMVFLPYEVTELAWIGRRLAEGLGVEVSPQAARRLAETAHGTPARVLRRIETMLKYWPEKLRFSQGHVERALALEGIDDAGLTAPQRLYLRCLAESGEGALRRLALHVGVDARYLADEVEPDLIFAGYVAASDGPRRALTAAGRELVSSRAWGASPPTTLSRIEATKP